MSDRGTPDTEDGMDRRTMLQLTGSLAVGGSLLSASGVAAADHEGEVDIDALVDEMSLEEKVLRTHGGDGPGGIAGSVSGIERLDIPRLDMADGPAGASLGVETTDFPHPIAGAATFNPGLVAMEGAAIALEAKSAGVEVLLGPSMDMFRVPVHARAGETFGEDPYLSSEIAAAYTGGVQSEGVIATLKHFAAYNQTSATGNVADYFSTSEHNVVVDERTLREVYLPPFKAAIQEGNAGAVMPAYNRVNGIFCSEHDDLLDDILKDEWGFDGFVVSDWFGTHSTVHAAVNGLDVEMPSQNYFGQPLADEVENSALNEETIDEMVRRGLRSQHEIGAISGERVGDDPARGTAEFFDIAQQMAEESTVLLKNDGVLPLDGEDLDEVALVGWDPTTFKQDVGGSDSVTPIRQISPQQGIEQQVGDDVTITTATVNQHELVGPEGLSPADGSGDGLTATYYPNADFSGDPVRTRVEESVDLTGSDLEGIDAESVSVSWSGTVTAPESGTYSLTLSSQGSGTVYLDDEPVVQSEGGGFFGPKSEEVTLELTADQTYDLRVEAAGTPPVRLEWNLPSAIDAAVEAATDADVALVVAKTDTFYGDDRQEYALPFNQNAMVDRVAEVNDSTVVLLNAEAPVAMPWIDAVSGALHSWYPGQEGGYAVANILFGEVNPSGKLPTTIGESFEDYLPGEMAYHPNEARAYPGVNGNVHYDEGVNVGYRHFDANGIDPLFEFGYGESYTEFEYSNLDLSASQISVQGDLTVDVDITNTGEMDGAEVVQVYVSPADPAIERPPKELAGFAKETVVTGETETVSIDLDREDFQYWDPETEDWTVDTGEYQIMVGASSRDIRVEESVEIRGPPANLDDDPMLEDVNGNGQGDIGDAITYYNHRNSDAIANNPMYFDFDGDGETGTIMDAIELFNDIK